MISDTHIKPKKQNIPKIKKEKVVKTKKENVVKIQLIKVKKPRRKPTPEDYAKTVIYTIRCRDGSFLEIYVGASFNLKERKRLHESDCNNPKRKSYNYRLYRIIRENGGWDNWVIAPYQEYPECRSQVQSDIMEEKIRVDLNATLNSQKAHQTVDERKQSQALNDKKRNLISVQCVCGKFYAGTNKFNHCKTKSHQKYIIDNQQNIENDIEN